jgi:mRNA interferase MazF
MPLIRGDVVLVQFPYSSGVGSKLRPAVVVQPDVNNRRLTNVILAPLTTTIQRATEPTQFMVDVGSATGKATGLRHSSVVSCENLTTVAQSLVQRRLGHLPQDAMDQVNECLKAA